MVYFYEEYVDVSKKILILRYMELFICTIDYLINDLESKIVFIKVYFIKIEDRAANILEIFDI